MEHHQQSADDGPCDSNQTPNGYPSRNESELIEDNIVHQGTDAESQQHGHTIKPTDSCVDQYICCLKVR